MTYGTEFYTDWTFQDFGYDVSEEKVEELFDDNVCVLQIPETPLRKWYYKDNSDGSFEDWITKEQFADDMIGFFDKFKDLYGLNPKRIGFQKYIDALKESEVQ